VRNQRIDETVSRTGRKEVVTQGKIIAGLAAFAVLCVAAWFLLTGSGGDSGERVGVTEYSALDGSLDTPDGRPEVDEPDSDPVVVEPDSKVLGKGRRSMVAPSAEESGGAVPVGKLRGHRFNVYGSPASEFDNEILTGLEFEAEEIAEIRKDFSAFIDELRDFDPEARVAPAIRLTAEERDENRRLRERYLDDREYDAALIATRQSNRAYFAGPIASNRPAAQVGLQGGDEVLQLNGVRIFHTIDFTDARDSLTEGQMHQLVVSRKGKLFDVSIQCCDPGWGPVQMRLGRPLDEPLRN